MGGGSSKPSSALLKTKLNGASNRTVLGGKKNENQNHRLSRASLL
jgi:hypothetical protein